MKPSRRAGFTMIEVMAALAILSISLVVLIRSQSQSLNNAIRVRHYERAVYITENQLHWTFLDLNEAKSWEEYANLSGEDGDYQWHVQIQATDTGQAEGTSMTMLRILATTRWPDGEREDEFHLETWYLWGSDP